MNVSILVPIYNESENIRLLYKKISEAMLGINRDYEILFIDDGSIDDSAKIIADLSRLDEKVRPIFLRRNYGQTAAMMAGIDAANGDVILPMDGDLQNDPADIASLLSKLDEGYEVVSGWRKNRKDSSLRRNLPSRIANLLISKVSGVHLHDYGCTLKAYKREILKDVKLYGEMHRFIPIYASWLGARVTEIPVAHHPRIYGVSKYGLNRIIKVILDLIVVKFLYKYSAKPIYVFGGIGLLFLGISFIALVSSICLKYLSGVSFIQTPLPLIAAIFLSVGFMSVLMGLLAEVVMRTYYESPGKSIYSIKASD